MNRKSLLCISIILLIVAVDFSYGQESRRRGDDKQTTAVPITLQQDVGNAGSNQGGLILTSLQGGSTARSDQRSGVKGSFGSQDGDKEDKDFGPQDGDKEDKDFGQRSGVKGSFGPQDGDKEDKDFGQRSGVKGSFGPQDGDKEDKDFGQRSGVKGNFGPQDGGKVVKGSLKIKGLGKESFKTKGVDKGAKDYSKDYGYGVGDPYPSYGGSKKGYNGGGLDGYYGDDGYGGKGIIGYEGKDPREHGKDIADFGPIYGSLNNMTSKLNVWICAVHDWRQKGRYGSSICGSNKYYSNKYDSDNYDSDEYGSDKYGSDKYGSDKYGSRNNYQNNQRRKRSYNKVTFPVKQVKNYKKFPFFRFPPLISIAPWLPIFYDKLTYQTFIFSLTGGLYIIPPLINFYGQRFAVAQLIKWGYASLVSSGVPPPPAVNVAPLVQPGPPPPPPAGGPAPKYEKGAVKTDYPEFRPRPDYLQKTVNDGPKDQGPGPYSG